MKLIELDEKCYIVDDSGRMVWIGVGTRYWFTVERVGWFKKRWRLKLAGDAGKDHPTKETAINAAKHACWAIHHLFRFKED